VGDLGPEAEARTAAANEKVREAHEEAERYHAFVRRVEGLTVPVRGVTPRDVPGLDDAAELLRVLSGWDLPVPLPELSDG
jgi:hypothetical protein